MATRISLIRSVRQKEEREQIGNLVSPFARALTDIEKSCLLRLSEAARAADQIQIALNSIVRAQRLERTQSFNVSQEFACVLWLQREQKLAVQYLKEIVTHQTISEDQVSPTKKALLLARLVISFRFLENRTNPPLSQGAWTSEACLEKPTDILTHFFDPATALVNIPDSTLALDPTCAAVYHQCAIFAERQYQAILKSPDVIRWKVWVDRKLQEIKRRQDQISRTSTASREYGELTQDQKKAQALLDEDQASYQRHNSTLDSFLKQAIDMYSRCLETSDDFDDDGAIRLCSLWFANFEAIALQDKVRAALNRVPSRKFVFLAHQLSARLSKSQAPHSPKHQENLQSLMVRMCEEHPFHSLYQVYCLRPERSPSSSSSSMVVRRQSSRLGSSVSQSEREAAACDIFDRLRGDTLTGERVRNVERICDASLQWAQYPIKDRHPYTGKKSHAVPGDLLIHKVQKLPVPVVTVHTPLDPTLRYDNCIWIERYDANFETAGGNNLPKISICYGSDGGKHKQLVSVSTSSFSPYQHHVQFKGEGGDDLRQDAVMEQVFDLVNVVLRRDRETRRRNLTVRGYKVIPLSAQAGVLEFVGNTYPLNAWLSVSHPRSVPFSSRL
jgi:ataxia telangiectasia mutated family protein